jgi:hypothetical protein
VKDQSLCVCIDMDGSWNHEQGFVCTECRRKKKEQIENEKSAEQSHRTYRQDGAGLKMCNATNDKKNKKNKKKLKLSETTTTTTIQKCKKRSERV